MEGNKSVRGHVQTCRLCVLFSILAGIKQTLFAYILSAHSTGRARKQFQTPCTDTCPQTRHIADTVRVVHMRGIFAYNNTEPLTLNFD